MRWNNLPSEWLERDVRRPLAGVASELHIMAQCGLWFFAVCWWLSRLRKLPASIREWYSLEGACELLRQYSNDDWPLEVSEFGLPRMDTLGGGPHDRLGIAGPRVHPRSLLEPIDSNSILRVDGNSAVEFGGRIMEIVVVDFVVGGDLL